jgi:DnaJ-class molecular chaperone
MFTPLVAMITKPRRFAFLVALLAVAAWPLSLLVADDEPEECHVCGGWGFEEDTCDSCNGTGGNWSQEVECPDCNGVGIFGDENCGTCFGYGRIMEEHSCETCSGSGTVEDSCGHCGGSGVEP